jgi:hypothetical protein
MRRALAASAASIDPVAVQRAMPVPDAARIGAANDTAAHAASAVPASTPARARIATTAAVIGRLAVSEASG